MSGNKTSSTPNPNPPSASIYSQHLILEFSCHMLVKRISTGEVMMLTDFVTSGKFPQCGESLSYLSVTWLNVLWGLLFKCSKLVFGLPWDLEILDRMSQNQSYCTKRGGPKEHLVKNKFESKHPFLRNRRSKYTVDDFWPDLWPDLNGIYLIIIQNEREFYELQVVKIVDQKVNCAQNYGWLSSKGLAEIWQKIDILAGCNSEAIQHIMLKLTVDECLKRN